MLVLNKIEILFLSVRRPMLRKKRSLAKSIIFAFVVIVSYSCVRPIPVDVDLEETDPLYVIEGEVNDNPGPY